MNVFYFPDLFVEYIAAQLQIQPKQIALVGCFFLSFAFGLVFQCVFGPGKASPKTRHALSLCLGLSFGFFCYRSQLLANVISAVIAYALINLASPKKVQIFVFCTAMGILSVIHLDRVIHHGLDDGKYKLDVSGSLMVLTQRLTALAFSIHDGMGRKKEDLTREQEDQCVREIPSVLEYFSYAFNFPTNLIGPLCFYRDYIRFIEGKHHKIKDKNGFDRETSGVAPSVKKFFLAMMWLGLYLKFAASYKIELNMDQKILQKPWIERSWITYVSMLTQRFRFYFAWGIGDSIANAAGLGFNGFDENSKEKWNLVTNANPIKAEFPTNFKYLLDHWNIQSTVWLRRICYERLKFQPLLLTNLLSAWWHGFFPILYVGWLGFGLSMLAARLVRRIFRHYFQTSSLLRHLYDVLTIGTTMTFLNYYVVAVALLDFWGTIAFWRSQYFFGHAIPGLVVVLYILKSRRRKHKKEGMSNGAVQMKIE